MLPRKGWLVIDLEWDPETGDLLSFGVGDPVGEPFATAYQAVPDWVRPVLADPDVGIVEHTLADVRQLRRLGVEVAGPIADTRHMGWNVDENVEPRSLENYAWKYCQVQMDKRITAQGKRFRCDDGTLVPIAEAPWDQLARYNIEDVKATIQLFNTLLPLQPEYWSRQLDFTAVLLSMELAGVPVDEEELDRLHAEYLIRREELARELTADLPPAFNLGSDDQVSALLFLKEFELPGRVLMSEEQPKGFIVTKTGRKWAQGVWKMKGFGLPPRGWTDSGKRPKVDADTLAYFKGHPWVDRYLEYQKVDKVIGTYLEAFPSRIRRGRLFGEFNQSGTVTGRLSSRNPNLQNIPRRGELGDQVRRLFRGNLIVADFSQLEPRLMAHWSKDPALLDVYQKDLDVYRVIGEAAFDTPYDDITKEQRDQAKTLFLGMSYGLQSRGLSERLTIGGYPTNAKKAQEYLTGIQHKFARYYEWKDEIIREARINGYIRTIGGRKRHLDFHGADSWRLERQTVNSAIQGSAADIVNEAMVLMWERGILLLLQIHDEVVAEYEDGDDTEELCAFMQWAGEVGHGFTLEVPLVFKPVACETWGDAK